MSVRPTCIVVLLTVRVAGAGPERIGSPAVGALGVPPLGGVRMFPTPSRQFPE
ncbi:MAG: hypothetical protein NVS2B7_31980 [Herpetosiphon sp.]